MSEIPKPSILIVGAGSMGVIMGYLLDLAGVEVTYLVRPHRAAALEKPQILYNFKDNTLKKYTGYRYVTNPTSIKETKYDYILITLDGANLRNETGTQLMKTIGEATRNTDTRVILGSIAFDMRAWLLEASGLAAEQVTNGWLNIHAYSPSAANLPIHAPADPELVAQADLAYIDALGQGFIVDDSVAWAGEFAELYNRCGVSKCTVQPALATTLLVFSLFPVFAACEVLGWPPFAEVSSKGEMWILAIKAVKEIQCLDIFGEAGVQAAGATTEEGLAQQLTGWEQAMRPVDLQAFNRFHHGGKVNEQDRALLRDCVAAGEKEGKEMNVVKELMRRREELNK